METYKLPSGGDGASFSGGLDIGGTSNGQLAFSTRNAHQAFLSRDDVLDLRRFIDAWLGIEQKEPPHPRRNQGLPWAG